MENVSKITREQLMGTAQDMIYNGYRFVTATCVDNGNDTLDVLYHFDKDLEIISFRVTVNKDEEIPSISKIYFCSAFVENEMKELFGLKVTNIVVDYKGHLLLSEGAPENPMAKQQITIVKKGE